MEISFFFFFVKTRNTLFIQRDVVFFPLSICCCCYVILIHRTNWISNKPVNCVHCEQIFSFLLFDSLNIFHAQIFDMLAVFLNDKRKYEFWRISFFNLVKSYTTKTVQWLSALRYIYTVLYLCAAVVLRITVKILRAETKKRKQKFGEVLVYVF